MSDDGTGSPEFLMQAGRLIGSVQRQLCQAYVPGSVPPAAAPADGDALVFDDEVVIAGVAAVLAPAYAPKLADMLAGERKTALATYRLRTVTITAGTVGWAAIEAMRRLGTVDGSLVDQALRAVGAAQRRLVQTYGTGAAPDAVLTDATALVFDAESVTAEAAALMAPVAAPKQAEQFAVDARRTIAAWRFRSLTDAAGTVGWAAVEVLRVLGTDDPATLTHALREVPAIQRQLCQEFAGGVTPPAATLATSAALVFDAACVIAMTAGALAGEFAPKRAEALIEAARNTVRAYRLRTLSTGVGTVGWAAVESVRRMVIGDDEVIDPRMLAAARRQVASIHRSLVLEHLQLRPRLHSNQALASGRRYYPLPAALEGVEAVQVVQGDGITVTLDRGALAEQETDAVPGYVERFSVMSTSQVTGVVVGAGGTGYVDGQAVVFDAPPAPGHAATGVAVVVGGAITAVTITDPGAGYDAVPAITAANGSAAALTATLGTADQLYLSPCPGSPGTLRVLYRQVPSITPLDADALAFDHECVISSTAALLAPMFAPKMAQPLAQAQATAMSTWRRRAVPTGHGSTMTPIRPRGGW
ncbi:MAG: hypothetical protein L6R48_08350 [Planctomycetes bacterium]|nr:hypothetical protein [Planctomycetota bacterium]